jgi:hypothetical protein
MIARLDVNMLRLSRKRHSKQMSHFNTSLDIHLRIADRKIYGVDVGRYEDDVNCEESRKQSALWPVPL